MQVPVRNSLTVDGEEGNVSVDSNMTVKEVEKELRDLFSLKRSEKFVTFLRTDKKWYKLDSSKLLADYPLSSKSKFDMKKRVSTSQIHKLRGKYEPLQDEDFPYGVLNVHNLSAGESKQILIEKAQQFLLDIFQDPKSAAFHIPSRSRENVSYDSDLQMVLLGQQMLSRQFHNLSSVKSVAQMTELMHILYDILDREIHTTKRDLFYMAVNSFESQNSSDALIEDIGAMMKVARPSINIWASSKGVVIGNVTFRERGDFIDCTKMGSGKSITPNVDDITDLQSDAEFVLVIEKDAVFNRLAEDHFYDYVPCILITAKGQPDMATREFLRKIDSELQLPILAIMDADVYGFEIMRVYSVGSKALSFESRSLAVPNIKWLGLLPSDLEQDSGYNIPDSTFIKMSTSDIKKGKKLLEEEFVIKRPRWKKEIEILLNLGIKAEIQALNARDPQFITNYYLPDKIERGDFI